MEDIEVKMLNEKRGIVLVPSGEDAYLIDETPLGVTVIKKFPKKTITELVEEAGKSSMKKLGEVISAFEKKKNKVK